MKLSTTMTWQQINESIAKHGYYISVSRGLILKDNKLVAKMINKNQAIQYVEDRVGYEVFKINRR